MSCDFLTSFNHSKEINEIITSSALKKAYLKSAWIANEEDIENLLIKYKRQDLYFATASSKEEVVKLLNKRCNLVFLDNVDLDELKNYVNECIARFEEAHSDLEENIISKAIPCHLGPIASPQVDPEPVWK